MSLKFFNGRAVGGMCLGGFLTCDEVLLWDTGGWSVRGGWAGCQCPDPSVRPAGRDFLPTPHGAAVGGLCVGGFLNWQLAGDTHVGHWWRIRKGGGGRLSAWDSGGGMMR